MSKPWTLASRGQRVSRVSLLGSRFVLPATSRMIGSAYPMPGGDVNKRLTVRNSVPNVTNKPGPPGARVQSSVVSNCHREEMSLDIDAASPSGISAWIASPC